MTIDTLRADRLGAYGSSRGLTPVLDRFAREGVRFDSAVAQVPLTLPSHATLLTGLRPPAHGVRTNDGFRLPEDVPTIAEALQRGGYRAAAFIAAFPLRGASGLSRGFEHYDDGFLADRTERPATEVVEAAVSWVRARAADRLFVWMHLFDPHTPYAAPTEHALRHAGAPYDAEVEYTDRAIGTLFDALRTVRLYDDALIVVAADHGESLGEHGERTHGTFLYDATIRVPLMIRRPGVGPRVVSVPVELTDIAPTIAAAARVPLPPGDGMDLTPLLAGGAGDGERPTYAESYYQNVLLGWSPLRAIRTAEWKYVEAPTRELYDLQRDPGETTNLAANREALAAGLAAALPPAVPAGSRTGSVDAEQQPRAESAERLRSLGYFSGRSIEPTRGGAPDPKDRIDLWRHLEEGIELASTDARAAERSLNRALIIDPANGLALKYLADLSYRARRYRQAAARYRAALDAGFEHPDVFVNLAAVASALGDTEAARQALERGVALDPQAADAWNQLGVVHASAGRLADARRAFERAIALQPSSAEAHYNLALVARAEGRAAEAMRLLDDALGRRPVYPEALFERGNGLLALGRHKEALDAFRAALAAQPEYPEALFGAARAAASLGLHEDAARDYERFLQVAPSAFAAHRAAARRELQLLRAKKPGS